MLPPEPVIRAALRWIVLLRSSSVSKAWNLILAGSGTAGLSRTQYVSALDWLKSVGMVVKTPGGYLLASDVSVLPTDYAPYVLFQKAVEAANPAWLTDADVLIPDDSELPEDAGRLAAALSLGSKAAYSAIQSIHGKVDTARRAMIGAAGESALVEVLEEHWPGSTLHVSQYSDAFGYDIRFRYKDVDWHLEVKSTMRCGRLKIFVSRNEYEIGSWDPNWRLIILGLDNNCQIAAIATLPHHHLVRLAPEDTSAAGKWQAASFELNAADLFCGVDFLGESDQFWQGASKLHCTAHGNLKAANFAWMPSA